MGCGASSPQEVAAPSEEAAHLAAPASSRSGPSLGPRSTKADSRASDDRDSKARLALARSVKKQVGFVPLFYIKSQFDMYDIDRNGALEVDELVQLLKDLQEDVDAELVTLGLGSGGGGGGGGGKVVSGTAVAPRASIDFHVFCKWWGAAAAGAGRVQVEPDLTAVVSAPGTVWDLEYLPLGWRRKGHPPRGVPS